MSSTANFCTSFSLMLFQRWRGRLCAVAVGVRRVSQYKPVVGIEVHMQIDSKSKLFSAAPTDFGGPTNKQVSLFDAAIPGTLPVLNRRCVEAAVQSALSFNCTKINNISYFDRKHYFYADMPAGFQITQQFHPVAEDGHLEFFIFHTKGQKLTSKTCRIKQIQLEQDSGKSIHDETRNLSLIDLNRAGVGLLEMVFMPDIETGEEAANLVKELISVVKTIGICTGRMEDGAVRVDANISVHKPGTPLGTRTEVKNLNSIRAVAHAVDYEIRRQLECVEQGKRISNVTMAFDTETDATVIMRDKEVVQDYRFFPEPNIPALNLKKAGICVETLAKGLPPLPHALRSRLMNEFNVVFWRAAVIVREPGFYNFFLDVMKVLDVRYATTASSILVADILGHIYLHSTELSQCSISPGQISELTAMLDDRCINSLKMAEVLKVMLAGDGSSPAEIVTHRNWTIINDQKALLGLCHEAIKLFPKEARKAARGKERSLNPLLAHIRITSDNRADMGLAKKLLVETLQRSTSEKPKQNDVEGAG